MQRYLCKCGCGKFAKLGNEFICGHNGRLLHHTEEAKTKMRKSQLASKFNIKKRKPVSQYDMNWNLINSFNSIIEASTNISISNKKRISNIQSNIQKCCSLKNKQKMAYGYIWEYTLIIDVAT